ncbi:unnamed protein product [Bemisia tabaci]|uniref:5'-3' exoribonuclease n=1 Tax=Bemisia tabaci TaxID=7038 RepID=A0A9P0CEI5_BEMTA|nr:PREDICTED: 5'-3' exoribonuclease 2 homolog [Bemisia tabaci]CAH0767356.1 unnamed protein product [Bemisia tabaci]
MGVPAFFRWLSRKYPSVIVHCVEQKGEDGKPVDSSEPNPNDIEFDNLYLDMNGIIHPCTHPEDKPAPKNEDEMMVAIFECIDRLFSIVRPRKLLYMAIDGVAPRAKMNQQRSRRFRASKETAEKIQEIAKIRSELALKGVFLPPEKEKGEHFDSNCITPGTPFMARLSNCLHYYIHSRLNSDPGWKKIKVILSDANVPGEGEHKIMDYIRRQRAQPDHDPNTQHCLCGADADLIMLGLATHEPYFTIIREEFLPNKPRPCEICGQVGHEMKECQGLPNESAIEENKIQLGSETQFIFVRLNILKEYLQKELEMPGLPFPYDFERAVDDWVFMCFFVGNDFLPHLPSLEIREGAIDRLVNLYKKAVYKTGGFVTDSGAVNLDRVQLILTDLGYVEDEIFKNRQQTELRFRERNKMTKRRKKMQEMRSLSYEKVNHFEMVEVSDEEEPPDEVKLWEEGFKDRYYESKFDVDSKNDAFRRNVAAEYVKGLCWVLKYYYQGCASWGWYFPYHYAPFASDFVDIRSVDINFPKDTKPFKPLEQLMGVFPAASSSHVPSPWAKLMSDPDSPIIDFYPIDFKIDLNGKKFAWQGVALLPFVDEGRLHKALEPYYDSLTVEEKMRNVRGDDRLYVGEANAAHSYIKGLYEKSSNFNTESDVLNEGMRGKVLLCDINVKQGASLISPVAGLAVVRRNSVFCARYRDPKYPDSFIFPARKLTGAEDPPKVLKPENFDRSMNWKPQIGMAPARQQAYLGSGGHRMMNFHGPRPSGQYSAVPPPAAAHGSGNYQRKRPYSNWNDGNSRNYEQRPNYGRGNNSSSYRGHQNYYTTPQGAQSSSSSDHRPNSNYGRSFSGNSHQRGFGGPSNDYRGNYGNNTSFNQNQRSTSSHYPGSSDHHTQGRNHNQSSGFQYRPYDPSSGGPRPPGPNAGKRPRHW